MDEIDGMWVMCVEPDKDSAPKADRVMMVASKGGPRKASNVNKEEAAVQMMRTTPQQRAPTNLTLDRISVDSQFNVTTGRNTMTPMSFQDILNSLIPEKSQGQGQVPSKGQVQCQVPSQGHVQGQEESCGESQDKGKESIPDSSRTGEQLRDGMEMNQTIEKPVVGVVSKHPGFPSSVTMHQQLRDGMEASQTMNDKPAVSVHSKYPGFPSSVAEKRQQENVSEPPFDVSTARLTLQPRPISSLPHDPGLSKHQANRSISQGSAGNAPRDRPSRENRWLKRLGKAKNVVVSIHHKKSSTRIVLAKYAPYVCGLCGSTFTHSAVISAHVAKVHGYVEPPEITRSGKGHEVVIEQNSKIVSKKKFSKQGAQHASKKDIVHQMLFKKLARSSRTETNSDDNSRKLSDDIDDDSDCSMNEIDSDSDGVEEMSCGRPNAEGALLREPELEPSRKREKSKKTSGSSRRRESCDAKETAAHTNDDAGSSLSAKKSKHAARCRICRKVFSIDSQRNLHLQEEHGEYKSAALASAHRQKLIEKGPLPLEIDLLETVKCPHCNTYFISSSAVEKHTRVHCGAHGLKCDVCQKAIQLWNEGKNEEMAKLFALFERGGDVNPEDLSSIGDEDSDERNAEAGKGVDGEEPGAVMDKEQRAETPAEELLRRSLERTNRVTHSCFLAPCLECGEQFYLRNHLTQHYRSHDSFTCKQCGVVLSKMSDLQVHLEKVHQTGHLKCLYCPRLYTNCGKLNYHMLGHLGVFQCIVCGATFMSKMSLERHAQVFALSPTHVPCDAAKHVAYSSSNPFIPTPGRKGIERLSGRPRYQCSHCSRSCVSLQFLRRHVRHYHPEVGGVFEAERESFMCDRCGALLVSKASFKNHLKIHEGKTVACTVPDCKKMFTTEMNMKSHLKTHDTGRVRVKRPNGVNVSFCEYCDKKFSNITQMRYHIKRDHTKVLDQVCDHCGKRFADPSTLKVHLRTHSVERPHKCQFCDKGFPTALYLKAHVRVHTKPFKCSQCGEGFSQQGARRSHLLRAHGIKESVERSGRQRSVSSNLGDDYSLEPSTCNSSTTTETTGEEYVAAIQQFLAESDYRNELPSPYKTSQY